MNKIIPFRGRAIDYTKPVWVFRNLHRDGNQKFSVVQDGLVIGHTSEIELHACRFIVREKGRLRLLVQKRKNVHAFIKGFIRGYPSNLSNLPARVTYNPYKYSTFVCVNLSPVPFAVHQANVVQINDLVITALI